MSRRSFYSAAVIVGAGLLLLGGFALFVAALLTATDALYWACVATCGVAAGLLAVARRQIADRSAHPVAADRSAEPLPAGSSAPDAAAPVEPPRAPHLEDPPVEEVEVTDLLLVVDLTDEVLVVDEHPRYHVAGCGWLRHRATVPLPLAEARTDGFTPCGACRPDGTLAERTRARRSTAS